MAALPYGKVYRRYSDLVMTVPPFEVIGINLGNIRANRIKFLNPPYEEMWESSPRLEEATGHDLVKAQIMIEEMNKAKQEKV